MKRTTRKRRGLLIVLVLALMKMTTARAQVPATMMYQGRLDAVGVAYEGAVEMVFNLSDGVDPGTVVWSETQNVSVQGGLFTVRLGKSTPLGPALFTLVDPELEVLIEGEPIPKIELSSVPYALRAADSDGLGGYVASAYQRRVSGTCATGEAMAEVLADGTVRCETTSGLTVNALAQATLACSDQAVVKYEAGTATWVCGTDLTGGGGAADWNTLLNLPADFADGVDDVGLITEVDPTVNALAQASLACADGEIAKYDLASTTWVCAPDGAGSAGASGSGATGLIPNGFFEAGAASWTVVGGTGAAQTARADAPGGSSYYENDAFQVPVLISDARVPIDPNIKYTVRGMLRRSPGSTGSLGTVYLGVQLYDENLTAVVTTGWWWPVNNVNLPDDGWHHYAFDFGATTGQPLDVAARYMTVAVILNAGSTPVNSTTYDVTGLALDYKLDNFESVSSGVYDVAPSDAPYQRFSADSLHTIGLGGGQIFIEGSAIDSTIGIKIGTGLAGGQAAHNLVLGGAVTINNAASVGGNLTVGGTVSGRMASYLNLPTGALAGICQKSNVSLLTLVAPATFSGGACGCVAGFTSVQTGIGKTGGSTSPLISHYACIRN